jgi:NIPSNAP protein
MIYELRIYRCMPARKDDLLARFRNHTMGFFKRHGIEVVGFWDTLVGESDELIYLTKYASWEEREKKWGAFMADPDWQTVRQQTQAHGPIVEHVRTSLLTTTDFSPKV